MFETHYDNMRMESTPERVLAICRLVASKPYTKDLLTKTSQIVDDASQSAADAIISTVNAAIELSLVTMKDGFYLYNGPGNVLDSYIEYRKYVADKIFRKKDSTFFKVTSWYIAQNRGVFSLDKWENIANEVSQFGIDQVKDNDILGWRFWASFVGIGYLYENSLIPNMKIRLQDAMKNFTVGTIIPAIDFVTWLNQNIAEANEGIINNCLPLAVSNGLRTLNELRFIELQAEKDTARVDLFAIDAATFNDFSHIVIKEGSSNELE